MHYGWSRVKRYSISGWRYCSTRFFLLLLLIIVSLSAWGDVKGTANFWFSLSSSVPILLLYFPLVGFLVEVLERDWKDWHLW
jgi:hypothetical protein